MDGLIGAVQEGLCDVVSGITSEKFDQVTNFANDINSVLTDNDAANTLLKDSTTDTSTIIGTVTDPLVK